MPWATDRALTTSRATPRSNVGSVTTHGDRAQSTLWKIHGEKLVDDQRRLRLSLATVRLPDGTVFEQYAVRMRKPAMMAVPTITTKS